MSGFIVYHNPRCSTSRKVVNQLRATGQKVVIVLYLKTPPDVDALRTLVAKTGNSARDLLRRKENLYATLGLADPALDDEALYQAMATHPILIERPIVIKENRAVLCRPANLVDTLI